MIFRFTLRHDTKKEEIRLGLISSSTWFVHALVAWVREKLHDLITSEIASSIFDTNYKLGIKDRNDKREFFLHSLSYRRRIHLFFFISWAFFSILRNVLFVRQMHSLVSRLHLKNVYRLRGVQTEISCKINFNFSNMVFYLLKALSMKKFRTFCFILT